MLREFLPLALQCALSEPTLWEYNGEQRTYWFAEGGGKESAPAFRACGALLGHALLTGNPVPRVFPGCVYAILLHDLESPHAGAWGLIDLSKVSPSMAAGLEQLCEYTGDDVADMFPLDWPQPHLSTAAPPRTPCASTHRRSATLAHTCTFCSHPSGHTLPFTPFCSHLQAA